MVQVNFLYPKIQSGEVNRDFWLGAILESNKFLNKDLISRALDFLEPILNNQDFLLSLETATILAELKMDTDSVVSGLLLIWQRNNNFDHEQLIKKFNKAISSLLTGIIKMDVIKNIHDNLDFSHSANNNLKADQLRKMLLAMASDPRVVVIRLAEHLCELRACRKVEQSEREKLANETKLIYAPLANRLGIGQIKWELEDLAFRYLEPKTYKEIANLLDEKRVDREVYIVNLINELKNKLAEHNIQADIVGRVKHIYSIWRKMHRKNLDYDELYDIRAVRVLTKNVTDCYASLGVVHSLWRNIPKEFDDYIATPKENGYQSLHTAVIGPNGKTVEVQIRTEAMHNDSELGVAAHWRYKEGVAHDSSFDTKIAWLRQLIEWQDELTSANDLLDELKTNIEQERVYVLTPNGDVFDLPEGSTPLDFAYHIHSNIGNLCRGAKVNNKMVQLSHVLHTGDKVEILTRSNGTPSRDWLNPHFNFLKTAKAIAKVRAWFKKQDYGNNLLDGKEILDRELHKLNVKNIDLNQVLVKLNFKTEEDLLAALGSGDIKISQVINFSNIKIPTKKTENEDYNYTSLLPPSSKIKKSSGGIKISGVDNLLTNLAGCCKPIPGNKIIGYISQGRGVTIHCHSCSNIEHLTVLHPERLVPVQWGEDVSGMTFAVDIFLQSRDRQGLLRDMTSLLSAEKINILNLKTDTDKFGIVHTYATIEITSVDALGLILDRLQALSSVIFAKRLSGTDQ